MENNKQVKINLILVGVAFFVLIFYTLVRRGLLQGIDLKSGFFGFFQFFIIFSVISSIIRKNKKKLINDGSKKMDLEVNNLNIDKVKIALFVITIFIFLIFLMSFTD